MHGAFCFNGVSNLHFNSYITLTIKMKIFANQEQTLELFKYCKCLYKALSHL